RARGGTAAGGMSVAASSPKSGRTTLATSPSTTASPVFAGSGGSGKRQHNRSHTHEITMRYAEEQGEAEDEDGPGGTTGATRRAGNCAEAGPDGRVTDENGSLQSGSGKVNRVRRVLSEPRVVSALDLSRAGLAQLESLEHSVWVTSDEEDGDWMIQDNDPCADHLVEEQQALHGAEDEVSSHSDAGSVVEVALDAEEAQSPDLVRTQRKKVTGKRSQRKRKKSRRKRDKDAVQVPYFKDPNGEIRDEYGFKVEEKEPEYLCTPKLGRNNSKHAHVPHDAKKKILSKEADRKRQRRVWGHLLDAFGGDIQNLPSSSFERWRKYSGSSRPHESAELYLYRLSSPYPDDKDPVLRALRDNDQDRGQNPPTFDSPGGASHRKQHSGNSTSGAGGSTSSTTGNDSPRRSSRALHAIGSVVRSIKSRTTRASKRKERPQGENGSPTTLEMRTHRRQLSGMSDMGASATTTESESGREDSPRNVPRHSPRAGVSAGMHRANTLSSERNGSEIDAHVAPPPVAVSMATSQEGTEPSINDPSPALLRNLTSTIRHVGIPPRLRRPIWLCCSGALNKQRQSGPKEQYEHLLQMATMGPDTPAMAGVIERDLHRTFPTNYHFEEEEGITRMRRVLLAYSLRNKSIGYCQSMNFLVAVLLLHMEESLAFWALAAIVEDLVPGHYTKQMTGMHVDQKVFESLVKHRLPKVFTHLDALNFPLEFVTYQWFLCLFVNSLPLETTLRIWDCFLHEGSKALFRAALAILMILQKEILACNSFQEVHECLNLGDNVEKKGLLTGDKVLKLAYDPIWFRSFPSSKLSQLRALHLPGVLETLGKQADWEDFTNGKPRSDASTKTVVPAVIVPDGGAVEVDEKAPMADMGTTVVVSEGDQQLEKQQQGLPDSDQICDGRVSTLSVDLPDEDVVCEALSTNQSLSTIGTTGGGNFECSSTEAGKIVAPSSSSRESIGSDGLVEAKRSTSELNQPWHARSGTQDEHGANLQMSGDLKLKMRTLSPELSSRRERQVQRRPSKSFKYKVLSDDGNYSPRDAMSRLGISTDSHPAVRPASLSAHSPKVSLFGPDERRRQRGVSLPRRASTNSPILLQQLGLSSETFIQDTGSWARVGTGDLPTDPVMGVRRSDPSGTLSDENASCNPASSNGDDAPSGGAKSAQSHAAEPIPGDWSVECSNADELQATVEAVSANESVRMGDNDDDDDASDIPSEFSGLLPGLAYVMSAQQVTLEEGQLTPRKTKRPISVSTSGASQMSEESVFEATDPIEVLAGRPSTAPSRPALAVSPALERPANVSTSTASGSSERSSASNRRRGSASKLRSFWSATHAARRSPAASPRSTASDGGSPRSGDTRQRRKSSAGERALSSAAATGAKKRTIISAHTLNRSVRQPEEEASEQLSNQAPEHAQTRSAVHRREKEGGAASGGEAVVEQRFEIEEEENGGDSGSGGTFVTDAFGGELDGSSQGKRKAGGQGASTTGPTGARQSLGRRQDVGGKISPTPSGHHKVTRVEEENLDWVYDEELLSSETPPLPARVDLRVVICTVVETLRFSSLQRKTQWRKLFSRAESRRVVEACFWMIFLDNFVETSSSSEGKRGENAVSAFAGVKTTPVEEETLDKARSAVYDRLSDRFFYLFSSLTPKSKDVLLSLFPDAVGQTLHASLCAAFPNSQFDYAFRQRLLRTVSKWFVGPAAAAVADVSHWGGESEKKQRGSMRRIMLMNLDEGKANGGSLPTGSSPSKPHTLPPVSGAVGTSTTSLAASGGVSGQGGPGTAAAAAAVAAATAAGPSGGAMVMHKRHLKHQRHQHRDDSPRGNLVHVEAVTVHETLELTRSPLIDHFMKRHHIKAKRGARDGFRMTQSKRVYKPVAPTFHEGDDGEVRMVVADRNQEDGQLEA
ncbi:Putative GTPase-activating protein AN11010, partial [Durusdinium trenchii]